MEDYAGFEPQVGEIAALRTFRIGPDGGLYPLYSDTAWTDAANTARCNVAGHAGSAHAAPEPDCTCGYYAYGSEDGTAEQPHAKHVLAVVSCWGKVVAGTRGIRAEHGHVDALWLSDIVPRDLATLVAARYPSISIYTDKSAMLAAHPPTALDCYVTPPVPPTSAQKIAVRVAVVAALILGSLPGSWIWQHQNVALIWGAEVLFFVGAAIVLRRSGNDVRTRRGALIYAAVALWLLAPFAGAAGTLLLRLPMLQVAALGLVQRARLDREARRFPAIIAHPAS